MHFVFLFPLIGLFFTWRILLSEGGKASLPRKILAIAIFQSVITLLALITGLLGLVGIPLSALFFSIPCTFGLGFWSRNQRYRRCSAYTEGKVVDIVSHGSGSSHAFYPVIAFEVDGRTYTAESDTSCTRNAKGSTTWVRYNPADPQEITQEDYEKTHEKVFRVLFILCLIVALICLLCGIAEIVHAIPT